MRNVLTIGLQNLSHFQSLLFNHTLKHSAQDGKTSTRETPQHGVFSVANNSPKTV